MRTRARAGGRRRVGVCHLTAECSPGRDPDEVVVRIVSTLDVHAGRKRVTRVRGVEAVTAAVEEWLRALVPDPDE